jgi:microcystin-dependent protein
MAISSALGGAGAVPVGVVNPFAGATAPSGWLLCSGQLVSRTQYPVLFTTIGTTYGAGDGSTTFAIPDMRGRSVFGKDNMGGTTANRVTATSGITGTTLGTTGGDERVQTHTHIQNPHRHTLRGDDPSYSGNPMVPKLQPWYNFVGIAHENTITETTATNQNFGAGSSQNMPPTIILNYIIKAQ